MTNTTRGLKKAKLTRVTLFLEDMPAQMLRVMAAEEKLSQSQIVTEFLLGERRNEYHETDTGATVDFETKESSG